MNWSLESMIIEVDISVRLILHGLLSQERHVDVWGHQQHRPIQICYREETEHLLNLDVVRTRTFSIGK
jgi:hypothetical protein